MVSEKISGTELRPEGHYLNAQYEKTHSDLYVQAARDAGLSVSVVAEGNVFDSERNISVSKEFVGVKVWISSPEDANKYWAAYNKLKSEQS